MLRTSVSTLAEQLRAYCEAVESDCNVMKSKLQNAPPKSACKAELSYLNNISAGLKELESRAEEMDAAAAGQRENRLNEITLEELLYCAATLYEANEDSIRRVKAVRNPSSAPGSTSKTQATDYADVSGTKENHVNSKGTAVELAEEEEDFNGCVVDLSYQSDTQEVSCRIQNESRVEDTALDTSDVEVEIAGEYNSPEQNQRDDEDPKTPSLEAWKLSHATRHILDQQRYISKGGDRSPENIMGSKREAKQMSKTAKNYSNAQVVTRAQADTPPSPGRLDVSGSYSLHRTSSMKDGVDRIAPMSIPFEANTPTVTTSPGRHCDASLNLSTSFPVGNAPLRGQDLLSTPIDEAREILRYHGRHTGSSLIDHTYMSDSPATPTLGGTPVTCQVIEPSAEVKNLSVYSQKSIQTSDEVDTNETDLQNDSRINISMGESDDGIDPISSSAFASPPKAVKVLNPRRGEDAIAADAENGWIPHVTEDEWKLAPSFLKMQFKLADLNTTLSLLNKFIAENLTKTENGFSKRLETFSLDEIVRIVGDRIGEAPLKIVVLGLVHFKKLDVGTENSVKVYKIRRFY